MNFKSICVCIFATFIIWDYASGCAWMEANRMVPQSNFQVVSNHSLVLFRQTFKGLEPHGKGSNLFNVKNYNRVLHQSSENKVVFIHTVLDHIAKLYEGGNFTAIKYNQDTLDMFFQILHRQTTELQKCIAVKMSNHTSKRTKRLLRTIRRRFQALNRYLEAQGYNKSSWEVATAVVLKHLERLHIVGASIK